MYYSARFLFKRKVHFGNIVQDAVGDRKLIRAIAYVVKTKTQEETSFFEALQKLGIELREKDLMVYFSGQKKADWDVGLAVDVIRMLEMLDAVVIVSGDGDFLPLVKYVQGRGRIVEVMAFRETTSSRLCDEIDGYINLSENKRRYLIGPAEKRTNNSHEEQTEPESEESQSFFMERGGDDKDLEEVRRNRLSF